MYNPSLFSTPSDKPCSALLYSSNGYGAIWGVIRRFDFNLVEGKSLVAVHDEDYGDYISPIEDGLYLIEVSEHTTAAVVDTGAGPSVDTTQGNTSIGSVTDGSALAVATTSSATTTTYCAATKYLYAGQKVRHHSMTSSGTGNNPLRIYLRVTKIG